jgi:hypothetical protein
MNKPLLPLTKFIVTVSSVVPLLFVIAQLFAPGLVNSFIWPPPFEPVPVVVIRYVAMAYLSLTIGGLYALRQNNWDTARGYLAVAASYVALSLILSIFTALTPPGVPPIVWLYIFLAVIHGVVVVMVWRQESART